MDRVNVELHVRSDILAALSDTRSIHLEHWTNHTNNLILGRVYGERQDRCALWQLRPSGSRSVSSGLSSVPLTDLTQVLFLLLAESTPPHLIANYDLR